MNDLPATLRSNCLVDINTRSKLSYHPSTPQCDLYWNCEIRKPWGKKWYIFYSSSARIACVNHRIYVLTCIRRSKLMEKEVWVLNIIQICNIKKSRQLHKFVNLFRDWLSFALNCGNVECESFALNCRSFALNCVRCDRVFLHVGVISEASESICASIFPFFTREQASISPFPM